MPSLTRRRRLWSLVPTRSQNLSRRSRRSRALGGIRSTSTRTRRTTWVCIDLHEASGTCEGRAVSICLWSREAIEARRSFRSRRITMVMAAPTWRRGVRLTECGSSTRRAMASSERSTRCSVRPTAFRCRVTTMVTAMPRSRSSIAPDGGGSRMGSDAVRAPWRPSGAG